MARVIGLYTPAGEKTPLTEIPLGRTTNGHASPGGADAATGHRQVALLGGTGSHSGSVGANGENVLLAGLDLASLGLGSRLRVGEALVAVTEVHRHHRDSERLLGQGGVFARVEEPGQVRVGDRAAVIEAVPRTMFQAVVLTISDRCSRGEAEDTAGPLVVDRLKGAFGPNLFHTEIIPDEREQIAGRLRDFSDVFGVDLVVTVGGTGMAPRDITPEATRDVVDRPVPGLDEAMRMASLTKTPFAALSRGASGIRGATLILNLPGSERGAVENIEAVLEALPHGLKKLRGDAADCPCCARGAVAFRAG